MSFCASRVLMDSDGSGHVLSRLFLVVVCGVKCFCLQGDLVVCLWPLGNSEQVWVETESVVRVSHVNIYLKKVTKNKQKLPLHLADVVL